ncbi:MAG TPA: hypothetical protein VK335_25140 [Bryobacteraceae bacterium]|nr:hypothetical protein [Bryobacteraceae bacterium]
MRLSHVLSAIAVVLAATLCLCAQEQATPTKDARPNEAQGLPPRAAPTDYQSQAKAGEVTIAAEFDGHSVPTEEQTLNTEDFVVVEVALFGPPGARTQISLDDFSLRVNGKKAPVPGLSYVVVFSSLKDPTWVSPDAEKAKESKTSIGTGGGQDSSNTPVVIHVPIELQRAMQQHTQKAALPLGNRTLPQAGLLFFQYRGKEKGINSVELIYSGAAGKATLALQR